MPSIADQLRAALRKSTRPNAEIAKEAGIHPVNLSRFKTDPDKLLAVDACERLAKAMGLTLTLAKGKR